MSHCTDTCAYTSDRRATCPFQGLFCDRLAADPDRWRLMFDRAAYWSSGMPTVPEPAGVCQIWVVCNTGGAERVMTTLLRATKDCIPWTGVGIISAESFDPVMHAEVNSLVPVVTGRDEIRDLLARSKVALTWGMLMADLPLPARRPRLIAVSHSSAGSPFAKQVFRSDRLVDGYVAVSRSALGPIPEQRRADAVVINNTIEWPRLKQTISVEQIRAEWGIRPGQKIIGTYQRVSHEKDPGALARAVEALPEEWVGVSVGDGYDLVRTHADALHLGGRVRFIKPRNDAGNVLRAFDVLLSASLYESFGLTMVEGMACGVPLVATQTGILDESPELATLAHLVPLDAPGSILARSVVEAGQSDGRRRRAAKEAVRQLYGYEQFSRSWYEFLARELEGNVPCSPCAKHAEQGT